MQIKEKKKTRERALMSRESTLECSIMRLPVRSREYVKAVEEYHWVRLQLCKLRGQKVNCVNANM